MNELLLWSYISKLRTPGSEMIIALWALGWAFEGIWSNPFAPTSKPSSSVLGKIKVVAQVHTLKAVGPELEPVLLTPCSSQAASVPAWDLACVEEGSPGMSSWYFQGLQGLDNGFTFGLPCGPCCTGPPQSYSIQGWPHQVGLTSAAPDGHLFPAASCFEDLSTLLNPVLGSVSGTG